LVLTPEYALSTSAAREVLPEFVSREDAVFNLQRIALLLQAVQSGNHSLLREALHDRIHQPFRQKLVPALEELLAVDHPDLLGVCLSGAGPSVVGLAEQNLDQIEGLFRDVYEKTGLPFTIRRLAAHHEHVLEPEPAT
jgi:homoserine kinase